MTAYVGVGSAISLTVGGSSVTSAWIDQKTQWLRCVAIGASAIHVATSSTGYDLSTTSFASSLALLYCSSTYSLA